MNRGDCLGREQRIGAVRENGADAPGEELPGARSVVDGVAKDGAAGLARARDLAGVERAVIEIERGRREPIQQRALLLKELKGDWRAPRAPPS